MYVEEKCKNVKQGKDSNDANNMANGLMVQNTASMIILMIITNMAVIVLLLIMTVTLNKTYHSGKAKNILMNKNRNNQDIKRQQHQS